VSARDPRLDDPGADDPAAEDDGIPGNRDAHGHRLRHARGLSLVARSAPLVVAGELAPMVAALVAMPAIVRGFGAERLGLLQLAWVLIGYFALFDLGLGRATTRMVAVRSAHGRSAEIPPLVVSTVAALFALGVASAAILTALTPWLVDHAFRVPSELRDEARVALYVLGATVPVVVVTAALRGVLEARQRFGALAGIRIGLGLASFLGPLSTLPFTSSLVPVMVVLAVARVIALFAHLAFCRDVLHGAALDWRLLPELVRYGGWLTVSNVVSPLLVLLDRFMIGAIVSVEAVAYYATPLEVVQRVGVVPTAVGMVLFPAIAATAASDDERRRELLAAGLRLGPIAAFPLLFLLSAWTPELLRLWLGPEFASHGTAVVRCVAIGLLFNAVAAGPIFFLQASGRPDLPAKFHLVEFAGYVPLLAWLTARYGVVGAASAWSMRVAVDAALLVLAANAAEPVPRDARKRLFISFAAGLSALCAIPLLLSDAMKIIASIVAVLGMPLAAMRWLSTPRERAWVRQAIG